MPELITITLPGDLVAEVEPLLQQSDMDLDTFVRRIVQAHITALQQRRIQERLARDYDELAAMYDELATELADEVWLPLENEDSPSHRERPDPVDADSPWRHLFQVHLPYLSPEVGHEPLQALVERHLRLPTQQLAGSRDVGDRAAYTSGLGFRW